MINMPSPVVAWITAGVTQRGLVSSCDDRSQNDAPAAINKGTATSTVTTATTSQTLRRERRPLPESGSGVGIDKAMDRV